jgi:hypothetical protein
VGRSNATERPVCPFSRFRRNRALDAAAEECPAYVRIIQGLSLVAIVGLLVGYRS